MKSRMAKPKVAIVILTWNNENDIEACLKSVQKIAYPNFQTLVVDNNSSDKTCSIVEGFKDIDLLKLEENLYFTGGNNKGIKYAFENYAPEYVMILNPDTEVEANLLDVLIYTVEKDKKIGAVGPKIRFLGGENDGKINSAGIFYDGYVRAYDNGVNEVDKGQYDYTKEVFGVTGTCILFRKEMLDEVGLFWEKIKMYLDEVELFLRAKESGWKVVYTGKTTVHHKHMSSSKQATNMNFELMKKWNWVLIAFRHYGLRDKVRIFLSYLKYRFYAYSS